MKRTTSVVVLAVLCLAGCAVSSDESPDAPEETGTIVEPAVPASPGPGPVPGPSTTEQVKAEPGVGIQGQSLQEHSGPLVQPAKSFFQFKQRTVFEIQIPQAVQLFQATEGRKPNSHEEFMSRIVEANNIKLPELPAGHEYVYDPESGELKVERPAQ